VQAHRAEMPIPGNRGNAPKVSDSRIGWVEKKVKKLQSSNKGAVTNSQLKKILIKAHVHSNKDRNRTAVGLNLGRTAFNSARTKFTKLPGVTFKLRNVRTSGRSYQELQLRNYASFVSVFNAFAINPDTGIGLLPNQFAMMDMVGIKVEQKGDHYAFTVASSNGPVVFEEKMPLFFKIMLCQFFNGTVAEPVILIADKSVKSDTIVKLRVPGLSPYAGPTSVGHVWISNPKGGGNNTFFREYFREIAIPAFRANAGIHQQLQVNFTGKKEETSTSSINSTVSISCCRC
jgi:hypothetical protein